MSKLTENTAAELIDNPVEPDFGGDEVMQSIYTNLVNGVFDPEIDRLIQEGLASGEPEEEDVVFERVFAAIHEALGKNP